MQTAATLSPNITICDTLFDPSMCATAVLCLEVGRERFRLLVQNARREELYLEEYTFPSLLVDRPMSASLPDVFRDHPVLSAGPWQEVRVGVNSSSFTLVPSPLFRKEYAGNYLALQRGSALPAHEFAQAHAHPAEGFHTVFNLEHSLADYFSEMFPLQPITFIHQISVLVQATAALDNRSLNPDNVYLYFEDEFVTIIYRHAHDLRYCNRFGYKQVQDFVYYLLYVLDEQQLDPEKTEVNLFGEITPFAEAYAQMSRFLPHLTFGHVPPGITLAPAFSESPEHRYLSLFGLGLMND